LKKKKRIAPKRPTARDFSVRSPSVMTRMASVTNESALSRLKLLCSRSPSHSRFADWKWKRKW